MAEPRQYTTRYQERYSIRQLATLAGCSPGRVINALDKGRIPFPDVMNPRRPAWPCWSEELARRIAEFLRENPYRPANRKWARYVRMVR
jgi:hypothetical protein